MEVSEITTAPVVQPENPRPSEKPRAHAGDETRQAPTAQEVATHEAVTPPEILNVAHLHPRLQKILGILMANQDIICTYHIGTIEFHWFQDAGKPDDTVSIKPRISLIPKAS